jgi:L-lactate utilization protein LutC
MTRGGDPLVAEFVETWRALEGDAWVVPGGRDEVRRAIGEAIATLVGEGAQAARPRVIAWATPEFASLDLPGLLAELGCEHVPWSAGGAGDVGAAASTLRSQAAASDLGITACAWAVAETGTIALYATPATGRLPSLLPTAHLALVRPSQVVQSVADGLRLLAEDAARHGGLPSAVNLVSGPSRSADIEGDLAVGVHGPKRAGLIIGDW